MKEAQRGLLWERASPRGCIHLAACLSRKRLKRWMGVEKMRAISGRKSGPSKRYLILAGAACFLTPLAVHASAILTLNTGLTAPDDNVALYADDATPQTVNVQIAGNDGQNLQGSNLY